MGSLEALFMLFIFSILNFNYVHSVAPQCKPSTSKFQGIFVEVFTPFNEKGKLNLAAIKPYAKYITDGNGVAGILILGVAGEGTSLTLSERKQVTDAWIQECAASNLTIIVQVGGTNFPDTLELARYVSKKVDAVITYPEAYYRPNSTQGLLTYFEAVAKAAYPAKIFYSDLPEFSEVALNMVKFYEEAQKIRNFAGLKAYLLTGEAVQANSGIKDGQSILVYNYLSIKSAFSFCLGASVSAVSSLFPKRAVQIQNAVYNGDEVAAFKYQVELNKIVNAILSVKNTEYRFVDTSDVTNGLPLLKLAMNMLTGVPVGPGRIPPLQQAAPGSEKQIRENLAKIGYKGEKGQGYTGQGNKGEGYKGQGNKGESNYDGEDYKGQDNKGEGYKGQGNKGESNYDGEDYKGQGNKGEGYKGQGNKGEGYKGDDYILQK